MAQRPPLGLLHLPAEIRLRIYDFLVPRKTFLPSLLL
jgi:hypothetical protein